MNEEYSASACFISLKQAHHIDWRHRFKDLNVRQSCLRPVPEKRIGQQ